MNNIEIDTEKIKENLIKKLSGVIGIARKAGAISAGSETILETIRKKKAVCVYLSCDASENTRKKLSDKTAFYNIPVKQLPLTMNELARCTGYSHSTAAAVSLTNKNFLKLINDYLKEIDEFDKTDKS